MVRYLCLLVLTFSMVASAGAAAGDAGWAGAFYSVPIGARPAAMGGAYLAISDDGAGPLYNPAGLSGISRVVFSSSYRLMKLDRVLGYATVLVPTAGSSVLGVHWLYAGDKGLKARDRDGHDLGWEISKNDHDFSILFAKRFESIFAAGVKVNYLQSTFAEMTAFTVAFDFGVMFYLSELTSREKRDLMPVQDIRVGVAVRHVAGKYRWNNDEYVLKHAPGQMSTTRDDNVPMDFGLGGSARFLNRKLLVASDLVKDTKQALVFHAGAEYYLYPQLALRAGYGDRRFSAGTGYNFKLGQRSMTIDYAFSTDKADEGSEHIFSFDLLF